MSRKCLTFDITKIGDALEWAFRGTILILSIIIFTGVIVMIAGLTWIGMGVVWTQDWELAWRIPVCIGIGWIGAVLIIAFLLCIRAP